MNSLPSRVLSSGMNIAAYLYICVAKLCDLGDFAPSDTRWLEAQHVTEMPLKLGYALACHCCIAKQSTFE